MKTFLIVLLMSISFAVCAQSEDEHYNHYIAHTIIIETGGEVVHHDFEDGKMRIWADLPSHSTFTLFRMVLFQMIEYNYQNVEIYISWIHFEKDNKYTTVWKHGENNYITIDYFEKLNQACYSFAYKRK